MNAQQLSASIRACEGDIARFHQQVINIKQQKQGPQTTLSSTSRGTSLHGQHSLKQRKILRGHFGKVYALSWCPAAGQENMLVSASQDGKLIIWDGITTNKKALIPLRSAWVMTAAYSTQGTYVACGGLDNTCSLFKVSSGLTGTDEKAREPTPTFELAQHDGYLSSCLFLSEDRIITSSGDSTVILWDVQRQQPINIFRGHEADVMSVTADTSGNTLVSGGVDMTSRVWDVRTRSCVQTHEGHESDINAVTMFPDDRSFGTASDDSSCRMWDIRSWAQVQHFSNDKLLCSVTSVAFSNSGRLLFAGYDDFSGQVWDVTSGELLSPSLTGHENRVSCVGVNRGGNAVCTGSWDSTLKIWA